jgi:Raf kinase inhibitor-like YbhB/YbcL family protein
MKAKATVLFSLIGLAAVLVMPFQLGGQENHFDRFVVTSTTFTNGGTLPLSMAYNASGCAPNGEIGGDLSPEVSWKNAPEGTRSFVVILFDPVASFTHWGMYNIAADVRELPEGAGAAGSSYGLQVDNDYQFGEQYDGPCPPTTLTPTTHEYVLTVYALDTELPVAKVVGDFLPGSEILYHELLHAAREGHILTSASIHGFFSAVSTDAQK